MKKLLLFTLLFFLANSAFAIDRRQDQSPRDTSYAFIPYAMSMPGIGSFYGFAGSYDNMFGSEADTYLATMTGDLAGYTGGIFDIPIPNEHLTMHWFTTNFSKAGIDAYGRGMDSSIEDMQRLIADKIAYNGYMANLKLWEKRIHIYKTIYSGATHPTEILDKDGAQVAVLGGEDYTFSGGDSGFVLDYTDDVKDPRAGLRFEGRNSYSTPGSTFDPDFNIIDFNSTVYIPVGKMSSIALNHFRSDVKMNVEGETNETAIAARLGVDCTGLEAAALAACEAASAEQISQAVAGNKYGTAMGLGGVNFLRAYPQNRFYAAHTRFYGSEFRWNFAEGSEAFDVFLAKGVRTILQVALFHEMGTVADQEADLGNTWKTSTGAGFRLLLSSGMVFRFDVGYGDEGAATTMFFNYPWGVMN